MNSITRSILRLPSLKNLIKSTKLRGNSVQMSSALWSGVQQPNLVSSTSNLIKNHKHPCTCISCRFAHSKAEKELVEFLAEEIVAEKKSRKLKTIPTEIKDFRVALNGAEVTLTKQTSTEKITISFNINHTVESEEPELDSADDKTEFNEIKSKPNFEIDIKRGNQTLSFACSFNNEPGASGMDDSYNDIFGIDEITLYEGEHEDTVYSVAGEIIDGYLYDLLMNYLEEKGISNEFADQIIELSTNYEHTAYIGLLEGLSKFTTK